MSSNKDENASGNIPSNEEIIDEVVDSCKKLGIDEKSNDKKDETEDNEDEIEDEDFIDEVYLKDLDVSCSQEELEKRKKSAIEGKELGNSLFKAEEYENARKKYTEALRTCPLVYTEERAMLYGNRAAAKLKQGMKKEAIEDCTKAVELNPKYVKAYIRRARLYEENDQWDEALADYRKVVEFDPGNSEARAAVMRLPGQIHERQERLKSEMLGSLKELGNKILKPFGLSTDSFQVQQDPNSGGYSINFTQNRK